MAMLASLLSGHRLRSRLRMAVMAFAGVCAAASPSLAESGPGTARPGACVERAKATSEPTRALTPGERRLILQTVQNGDEKTEAPPTTVDDATLVATVLRYAQTELGQRICPSKVDRIWAVEPATHDVAAELEQAQASGRLAEWLANIGPPHAGYRRLRAERRRYLLIVDAGGWAPIPAGATLREGDESPIVAQLRLRLALQDVATATSQRPNRFDGDVTRALKLFQQRNGLLVDGDLGTGTREVLNISAEARLGQIEANLERWRWLPHTLPDRRIEVDIAGEVATLFEAGRPSLEMRVVVGDRRHKTPMFTTQVEGIVFNPPWNVPASIAANELLPREAREPGYLERNGFERRAGRLVQRAGPNNALGRLKFEFPSPFSVYLHDTPARAVFARPRRDLSHGCVRLEKPVELARALLAGQSWTPAMIDDAVAAGTTRRVAIKATIPLYFVYRTAVVDDTGALNFRPDIYSWDTKLLSALAPATARSPDEVRLESECSASSSH